MAALEIREEERDGFYRMHSKPRGLCLIINNYNFEKLDDLQTGPIDGFLLKDTFYRQGFITTYCENLSSRQLIKRMECIASTDHSMYDCFVCCILTHGKGDEVYGSDDTPVKLEDLLSNFSASRCDSLAGKPKLFIVSKTDMEKRGIPPSSSATTGKSLIPDESDFLVACATTPGTPANGLIRSDPIEGSRFIFLLTQLLDTCAESIHLIQILEMVASQMKHLFKQNLQKLQSSLSKKLYFHAPFAAGAATETSPAGQKNPPTKHAFPKLPEADLDTDFWNAVTRSWAMNQCVH